MVRCNFKKEADHADGNGGTISGNTIQQSDLYDAGKYEVIGAIRNKETGKVVETDVPVFIMMGTDKNTPQALAKYFELCVQSNHVVERATI